MDVAGAGDDKTPPGGLRPSAVVKQVKRKMKSPYQLEILQKTYAVETYPSEELRAELSVKTGLTDRQLQMWFCHRRLKDRKDPPSGKRRRMSDEDDEPAPLMLPAPPPPPPPAPEPGAVVPYEPRKKAGRAKAPRITEEEGAAAGKRYHEVPLMVARHAAPPPLQLSVADLRMIASVEAQLGESVREDGPVLGVEFDPLPPGAFGAPIAPTGQQKQPVRPYDSRIYERHDETNSFKAPSLLVSTEHSFTPTSSSGKRKPSSGGALVVHSPVASKAMHEYQFLPEQPSIRSDSYDRTTRSHSYETSVLAASARGHSLLGVEHATPTYTFQGHMTSAVPLSQQGRHQSLPSTSEYESAPHSNSYANEAQFGVHQAIESENPLLASDRRVFLEDDTSRMERKRKSEEARIAKEVEAHEKRIRRELEKQDILRKKREEQMRKEMDRHERERRKEEERILRERQREEERFQREQRREQERREKFMQKESLRAEKLRQKEELRREKEAAKFKAANERATARRIAKESMGLIEDERLELMELAAASKGLSSIISLDTDTLEHLDRFREKLSVFPPKVVQLKRPFSIQPWSNSEENIGNLLMVWKFLITFADVLGLWPFTLDEFVQSLHDYDSRLLIEIHVALLKSIIKDIEDVARTPAGVNQNSAATPGGGHPKIVEGAYAWGFDICSWQRHLNPLTWPEILRQFALSAGFGPQLKKRDFEHAYFHDDNERNDGENAISTLRTGAAAESAVALMQEKGYPHRRKSRHRLTPGTVKFAAFHILSLEGSDGLTILEVADKIQKSGLRDLTTSKTPEASISVALSRDTKLFERTAPSTYCVRTPYRKDPADADAILSAAREKIQTFLSGLSDSEEAEKNVEEVDDAERDDDSECDVADDIEVDGVDIKGKSTKSIRIANESRDMAASNSLDNETGQAFSHKSRPTLQNCLIVEKGCLSPLSGNWTRTSVPDAPQSFDMGSNYDIADVEDTDIDDNNFGEAWVQGLTEGEYSELTVEERLNALSSLIGVAMEGNSLRAILEERLEAATALKKQMLAEAHLDRRRFKEDYADRLHQSSFMGCKVDEASINAPVEESLIPLEIVDNKGIDRNLHSVNNDQFLDRQKPSKINNAMCTDTNFLGQEFSANTGSVPPQQHGSVSEKSRSQLKSYIGHKAEELYVYRSLPLGQDRRRNRYWLFSTSASRNDPGSGRIFFESRDGFWRLIDTEEAFDSLLAALDTRGIRESHLHSMLQRIETTFKETNRRQKANSVDLAVSSVKTGATEMASSPDCSTEFDSPSSTLCDLNPDTSEYSSSFRIGLGRNEGERKAALKRYNCFLRWMWKECHDPFILFALKYGTKRCLELLQICHLCYQSCFAEDRHCPSCHKTYKSIHFNDGNFQEHVGQCEEKRKADPNWKQTSHSTIPIGIQLLKAQLSLVEASIPAEALQSFWTEGYRKSWSVKLQSSSSAKDLLQILTLLEGAVKRDGLSSKFETTNELLMSASGSSGGNASATFGTVPVLPWVPDTTAAVALRLLDLDASVSYVNMDAHREREAEKFTNLPARYAVVNSVQDLETAGTPEQVDYQFEEKWLDPANGRRGRGRGGRGRGSRGRSRGRGRGGRGAGLVISTSTGYREVGSTNYEKRKYTRRGRARGRGRGRGRRTVRPRHISESRIPVERVVHFGRFDNVGTSVKHDSSESSSRSSGGEEWHLAGRRMPYVEDDYNNSPASESDGNVQASGDEYDDHLVGYGGDYASKPTGLIDDESEEDDAADEDGLEDDRYHVGHRDLDANMDDEYEGLGDDSMDFGDRGGHGHGHGHEEEEEEEEEYEEEEDEEEENEGASSFSSDYSD